MSFDGTEDKVMSRAARKAELLDAETELQLAFAWRDQRDEAAPASFDHRLYAACDFDGIEISPLRRADE